MCRAALRARPTRRALLQAEDDSGRTKANGFRPHFELLEMIGAVEFEAGNEAGANVIWGQ